MKKLKQQKGITLVALVITIVILLILAGISIQALSNTGLFGKAQEARNATENAQKLEEAILGNYLKQINEITGEKSGGVAESSTNIAHTATDISAYSWDDLSSMAKAISNNSEITNDTLEVNVTLNGVTKTLGVGDYTTVDEKKVRILGFNHDSLTTATAYDGAITATGKAGISFEYVEFIDVDGNGTTNAKMNNSDTNLGGWEACELRTTLNSTIYNNLSIKDKIKQVTKDYIPTYDSASTTTCDDYLWLISCAEIWDDGAVSTGKGYAMGVEGIQYKYYKLGNISYGPSTDYTKKPNVDSSSSWWTRSPFYGWNCGFCYVYSSGWCSGYSGPESHGVAPGFCV